VVAFAYLAFKINTNLIWEMTAVVAVQLSFRDLWHVITKVSLETERSSDEQPFNLGYAGLDQGISQGLPVLRNNVSYSAGERM
jgi:hypothetical protein